MDVHDYFLFLPYFRLKLIRIKVLLWGLNRRC